MSVESFGSGQIGQSALVASGQVVSVSHSGSPGHVGSVGSQDGSPGQTGSQDGSPGQTGSQEGSPGQIGSVVARKETVSVYVAMYDVAS